MTFFVGEFNARLILKQQTCVHKIIIRVHNSVQTYKYIFCSMQLPFPFHVISVGHFLHQKKIPHLGYGKKAQMCPQNGEKKTVCLYSQIIWLTRNGTK